MSIDVAHFKQVMAQWSSGITVITSTADGQWQGITANSFASVSLNPPLVSVSIDKKLYIHSVIEQSKVFAANILSANQVEWGKLFAGFFPEIEDRFEGIKCAVAVTGSPILPDTVGWVDCEVRCAYEAGDHTIFVGEVMAGDTPVPAPPLAYHNRAWGEFVQQMPERVQIIEVGPAENVSLPTEARIELIESLVDAGISRVQIATFAGTLVHPRLADGNQAFSNLQKREGVSYSARVLDVPGLEQARAAGFAHVDFAVSVNDRYNHQVANLSTLEAMEQFTAMVSRAREYGMVVHGHILNAFDGDSAQEDHLHSVIDMARSLLDVGVEEIVLADTTGSANPLQTRQLVTAALSITDQTPVGVRLNDMRGMGLANLFTALESGITRFETVFGGSATDDNNRYIPTEDTVYMLQSLAIETNIDLNILARISQRMVPLIGTSRPAKPYPATNSTEKAEK